MEINLINDELIIKLPLNNYSNSKNEIIEYLKYLDATSNTNVSENDFNELMNEIKENRWDNIKKENYE